MVPQQAARVSDLGSDDGVQVAVSFTGYTPLNH
jgi:hypothetical protein